MAPRRLKREKVVTIDKFAGLSDRKLPAALSRYENPDMLNCEMSERGFQRRKGYTRVHDDALKNSSVRLDGVDDHLRIAHHSDYQWSDKGYVSIHCRLHSFPTAEIFVVSKGYGTGANRFISISYDPTVNTNAGGWKCKVYDATNTTLRTMTVNDGDGGATTPMGSVRMLELAFTSGSTYTFSVLDEDGSEIGTATATIASWITDSTEWFIGVDQDSSGDPVSGSYADVSVAEFRLADASATPGIAAIATRELDSGPSNSEASSDVVGYWKLNDGGGITFADSHGNGNNAIAYVEGFKWETDPTQTIGGSGLRFNGGEGFGFIDTGSTFTTDLFNAASSPSPYTKRSWVIEIMHYLELKPGATTPSAQSILWSGTTPGTAQPIGLEINSSQQYVFSYIDGTGLKQATLTIPSTWHNKRVRLRLWNIHTSSAESMDMAAMSDADTTWTASTSGAQTTSGDPTGTVSQYWCIGNELSSAVHPFSVSGTGIPAFGVIDDIRVIRDNTGLGIIAPPSPNQAFQERLIAGNPAQTLFMNVRCNEGSGNILTIEGAYTMSGWVYPEEEQGVKFDSGMVEQYDPVALSRVIDYRRITPDSSTRRRMLTISGTGLHEVDLAAGEVEVVAGNLPTAPIWTADQYAGQVYMASANGKRPIKWDGSTVSYVGRRAPFQTLTLTETTTGGSLADGNYYVYMTYRNSETGDESAPGPPTLFTATSGATTSRISGLSFPTSADPAVNQRRFWITTVGSPTGSTAYLCYTVNDNTTTSLTSLSVANSITSVDLTAETLEYERNFEAPQGSVVAVWKDRLWVAGNSEYPTRVWYSQPGALNSFRRDFDFIDADLDEGDPVVALIPIHNALSVQFRDGRAAITPSNNSAAPFFLTKLTGETGAISDNSIATVNDTQFIVGERDIYLWDGVNSANISSPADPDQPSIERTLRQGVEPSRKNYISVARHRARNQVWTSYSSLGASRNDSVLVYDLSQRIWSRYEMDMDFLHEIEDSDDDTWIYGGSRGYVVKLDTDSSDGHAEDVADAAGTVTGGSTSSLTDTSQTWTADQWKGLYVFFYDASEDELIVSRIRSNTTNTLYFYAAVTNAPASPDGYIIGGIQWYADWFLDFGDFFTQKKLRWARFQGVSDSSANRLRVSVTPDALAHDLASITSNYDDQWTTTEGHKRLLIGGLGRSFRFRIGSSSYADAASLEAVPAIGDIQIHAIQIEAEQIEAP